MIRFFQISSLILATLFLSSCKVNAPKTLRNQFSAEELELIINKKDAKAMRVLQITNPSDSTVLRQRSASIDLKQDIIETKRLVERMKVTMLDSLHRGIGIAAVQVGVLKRVIIVQRLDKPDSPVEAYFNPEIQSKSSENLSYSESCLSIPNRSGMVPNRAKRIVLSYQTIDGEVIGETIEGATSLIFQHEIDHLDGILFIDHLREEMGWGG